MVRRRSIPSPHPARGARCRARCKPRLYSIRAIQAVPLGCTKTGPGRPGPSGGGDAATSEDFESREASCRVDSRRATEGREPMVFPLPETSEIDGSPSGFPLCSLRQTVSRLRCHFRPNRAGALAGLVRTSGICSQASIEAIETDAPEVHTRSSRAKRAAKRALRWGSATPSPGIRFTRSRKVTARLRGMRMAR